MVWHKRNAELNPTNLCATFKHSGGNILVWACISTTGVDNLVFIEDIMNKNKYLKLFKEN